MERFLDWFRSFFSEKKEVDEMKYLIIGLGNIGDKYDNTRHNIGFNVVDRLSALHEAEWKLARHSLKTEVRYKGKKLILIKPTTFMNLSGKAVKYWMTTEKISPSKVLIVVDDLHIDFNRVKIKPKGNHAGHNGLKNIDQVLGHHQYPRLRVGIGNDFHPGQQVNYVLGEWSRAEEEDLPFIEQRCIEVIYSFVQRGIDQTMSGFNKKPVNSDE